MKTVLETPRLVLRELSSRDLDFIAALLAHPEVMRYWPHCYNRAAAADWISRQEKRYADHGVAYWLALDKESGEPVGQAGLLVQSLDGSEELGLGYIMHRPFWRMGFATEAATGCLDYAFKTLDKTRVVAAIRPENTPSRGVAAKLGMTVEKTTQYAGFEHLVFVASRSHASSVGVLSPAPRPNGP
jgi:RimJ/RimL family protein N-acetyltransferase